MILTDMILSECGAFEFDISRDMLEKLDEYAEMLAEWNNRMNLTAITEPYEMTVKHYIDSLYLLKYCKIPENSRLVDVGTGAGFPGMVLKILRPDLKVTLLDSLNKRLIFLNEVANALEIDIETVHLRAEEAGRLSELRESFDVATARAVARLSPLCEYCLPLVKVGGSFISMKGSDGEVEFNEAKASIEILGGGDQTITIYDLPNGDSRTVITVKKISQTPTKYPRQGIKITKKPL